MKSNRKHIFIFLVSFTLGMSLFAHSGEAQVANAITSALMPSVEDVVANLVNIALSACGVILTIAGALLNVSMVVTLQIKDFVDNTPAVYGVWMTIRDISGIFFIFLLLYAAIRMILDLENNYKSLITNIVIAGVLVNFSFFFVSVLIDGSNVVSQAIYNSMLPGYERVQLGTDEEGNKKNLYDLTNSLTSGRKIPGEMGVSGGISDIFMNSLKIPTLYNLKSMGKDNAAAIGPLKIVVIGIVGMLIMVTTAISFTLAALAFILRLVILIFILAFSPLWIISWVIPQLRDYSKKLTDEMTKQLLFMPVYLLLMYVALSILNNNQLFGMAYTANLTTPADSVTNWAFGYIILGINFTIVIVMLNLPLAVGLSMGGFATDKLKIGKWGADAIWKRFGNYSKRGASSAWRNTGGMAANSLVESERFKNIAARSSIGASLYRGVNRVGSEYNASEKARVEKKMKFAESLGHDKAKVKDQESKLERLREMQAQMAMRQYDPRINQMDRDDAAIKAKEYAAEIKKEETNLTSIKNERRGEYTERLKNERASMWVRASGSSKEAAEQIQKEIHKKELERLTKELEKAKENIKSTAGKIENLQDRMDDKGTTPTAEQTAKMGKLKTEQLNNFAKQSDLTTQVKDYKFNHDLT